MASITVSGSCTVTKDGVTSTLTGSFTADVERVIELSRDLDTTFQEVKGGAGGLAFVFIANNGSTVVEWAVLPVGGATEYLSGPVPPGGHALIPSYIFTDAGGAPTTLSLRTATGTGSAFVIYGTKNA